MEYVQLVCALIGVLALIFLFFWILRKVNKGILSVSGKRLKVLDRASLGGEKSVVVVSVAGKCMVFAKPMTEQIPTTKILTRGTRSRNDKSFWSYD